jgi:hypothetical protein
MMDKEFGGPPQNQGDAAGKERYLKTGREKPKRK